MTHRTIKTSRGVIVDQYCCSICGEWKPAESFHRGNGARLKHCKGCHRKMPSVAKEVREQGEWLANKIIGTGA